MPKPGVTLCKHQHVIHIVIDDAQKSGVLLVFVIRLSTCFVVVPSFYVLGTSYS